MRLARRKNKRGEHREPEGKEQDVALRGHHCSRGSGERALRRFQRGYESQQRSALLDSPYEVAKCAFHEQLGEQCNRPGEQWSRKIPNRECEREPCSHPQNKARERGPHLGNL